MERRHRLMQPRRWRDEEIDDVRCSKSIPESAVEGARLRFRPVMMTSFAFILGLLPLVIAEGPSALSRRAIGTPVFGGMIAAAFIGILLTPSLYVVFQRLRESASARNPIPTKKAIETP